VLVAIADFPAHIIKHNANPKLIWTSAPIMFGLLNCPNCGALDRVSRI
jgi:hypothetical protein